MPSTREIRRRIKSVKNTAQITKAMQLVAAAKMKKAQDQANNGRAYADLMNKVLVNLKEQADEEEHPLLIEKEGGRELVILITTDRGLCGALNTNILRMLPDSVADDAAIITIGNKGKAAMARLSKDLIADFSVSDPVKFSETKPISKFIMEKFLAGEFSTVKVAFTNFINTLTQEPMVETLLPIRPIDLGRDSSFVGMGDDNEPVDLASSGEPLNGGYLFEPSAASVLDTIVPQYVDYQLYQMVLENKASEHSSRMVAMKSATDNADSLTKDLTLEYNKIRQAAITSELLDIITAMKAVE